MPALEKLPRASLLFLPTPVTELARLSDALGGPRILVKRDDLTGLGLGGNKTRKLEFLLGEALALGCDTVVTGGAAQSNHCRQTAAAAAVTGLRCHLALGGEPQKPEGNLLLDHLLGATVHWCGNERKGERLPQIADELRVAGRRPYVIPYGGSNAVGACGFVAAMAELEGLAVDHVVFPSSSGGTQAGMAVGAARRGLRARVLGIGIDEEDGAPYESSLADLANRTASHLCCERTFRPEDFHVVHDYAGPGYGVVTPLEREAVHLLARLEGLLIDPVYTGRAMGGLIDLIRKGRFRENETILFWHTGGIPALFAYASDLVG